MSSVVDEYAVMTPAGRARVVLAARVRSLRTALEDVETARRGSLLTFAVPSPDLESLSDLDLLVLLLRDPTRLPQVPSSRLPALVGLVRLFEAKLLQNEMQPAHIASASTESKDRLLTAKQAAERLGLSTDYLYRNAARLPFVVRPSPRSLRFSSQGLDQYIERSLQGSRGSRKASQKPLGGARP